MKPNTNGHLGQVHLIQVCYTSTYHKQNGIQSNPYSSKKKNQQGKYHESTMKPQILVYKSCSLF